MREGQAGVKKACQKTISAGGAAMMVAEFKDGKNMAELATEYGVTKTFVEDLIRRVMVRCEMKKS